jgi:hypothetical protein
MIRDFDIWLKEGIDKGWISTVYCGTHDGPDLTEEEQSSLENGNEPCIYASRIYGTQVSDV